MESNLKKSTNPNNQLHAPTVNSQDSVAIQEMPSVSNSLDCNITI